MTVLPLAVLYVRTRDKVGDPDFKETYLRDILYKNTEISKFFKDETLHVLDYDCEYDRGYPDADKFPEFNNKVILISFNFSSGDSSILILI